MTTNYETPRIEIIEIELESILCTSITAQIIQQLYDFDQGVGM